MLLGLSGVRGRRKQSEPLSQAAGTCRKHGEFLTCVLTGSGSIP